ncbi:hypothetical protein A2U01_0019979 [Trifolium medium]|uniref:Uncharacterized protein n=1 Tax=Trifolium medium TaxID=97028 RepID=A0A392NGM7_9FABA|nr:hypothetical protein [Trifolium medium]
MEFKTTKHVLLPSLSEPQRAHGEICQKVSGSKRAPAISGDAPSLGEISLTWRVLNVFLVKLKNKGVARRAFIHC